MALYYIKIHTQQSKVNDFYLIWKGVCDFLLDIDSNLGP